LNIVKIASKNGKTETIINTDTLPVANKTITANIFKNGKSGVICNIALRYSGTR